MIEVYFNIFKEATDLPSYSHVSRGGVFLTLSLSPGSKHRLQSGTDKRLPERLRAASQRSSMILRANTLAGMENCASCRQPRPDRCISVCVCDRRWSGSSTPPCASSASSSWRAAWCSSSTAAQSERARRCCTPSSWSTPSCWPSTPGGTNCCCCCTVGFNSDGLKSFLTY